MMWTPKRQFPSQREDGELRGERARKNAEEALREAVDDRGTTDALVESLRREQRANHFAESIQRIFLGGGYG